MTSIFEALDIEAIKTRLGREKSQARFEVSRFKKEERQRRESGREERQVLREVGEKISTEKERRRKEIMSARQKGAKKISSFLLSRPSIKKGAFRPQLKGPLAPTRENILLRKGKNLFGPEPGNPFV